MLIVQTNSLKAAYSQALRRLLFDGRAYDDPELFREDVALIEISPSRFPDNPFDDLFEDLSEDSSDNSPTTLLFDSFPPVIVTNSSLDDSYPYHEYFPWISSELVGRELDYWNQQLFKLQKLPELISYLKENPLSKRPILLIWEDRYRDLSKGAVCEIALVFRL